jgi:hypothetical protein
MFQQSLPLHPNLFLTKETALARPKAGICFSTPPMMFFFFFSFRKDSWQRMFAGS